MFCPHLGQGGQGGRGMWEVIVSARNVPAELQAICCTLCAADSFVRPKSQEVILFVSRVTGLGIWEAKHKCRRRHSRNVSSRGCRVRVTSGYCATHARPAWGRSEEKPKRIRGRAPKKKRRHLFAHEPLRRLCRREWATIRDHIVPLAEGGADDSTNEQPACRACSDAKTQREAYRGRMRAGLPRK